MTIDNPESMYLNLINNAKSYILVNTIFVQIMSDLLLKELEL